MYEAHTSVLFDGTSTPHCAAPFAEDATQTCTCMRTHMRIHTRKRICARLRMHAYMHTHTFIHAHTHASKPACTHTYTYTLMHTCTHARVYIHAAIVEQVRTMRLAELAPPTSSSAPLPSMPAHTLTATSKVAQSAPCSAADPAAAAAAATSGAAVAATSSRAAAAAGVSLARTPAAASPLPVPGMAGKAHALAHHADADPAEALECAACSFTSCAFEEDGSAAPLAAAAESKLLPGSTGGLELATAEDGVAASSEAEDLAAAAAAAATPVAPCLPPALLVTEAEAAWPSCGVGFTFDALPCRAAGGDGNGSSGCTPSGLPPTLHGMAPQPSAADPAPAAGCSGPAAPAALSVCSSPPQLLSCPSPALAPIACSLRSRPLSAAAPVAEGRRGPQDGSQGGQKLDALGMLSPAGSPSHRDHHHPQQQQQQQQQQPRLQPQEHEQAGHVCSRLHVPTPPTHHVSAAPLPPQQHQQPQPQQPQPQQGGKGEQQQAEDCARAWTDLQPLSDQGPQPTQQPGPPAAPGEGARLGAAVEAGVGAGEGAAGLDAGVGAGGVGAGLGAGVSGAGRGCGALGLAGAGEEDMGAADLASDQRGGRPGDQQQPCASATAGAGTGGACASETQQGSWGDARRHIGQPCAASEGQGQGQPGGLTVRPAAAARRVVAGAGAGAGVEGQGEGEAGLDAGGHQSAGSSGGKAGEDDSGSGREGPPRPARASKKEWRAAQARSAAATAALTPAEQAAAELEEGERGDVWCEGLLPMPKASSRTSNACAPPSRALRSQPHPHPHHHHHLQQQQQQQLLAPTGSPAPQQHPPQQPWRSSRWIGRRGGKQGERMGCAQMPFVRKAR